MSYLASLMSEWWCPWRFCSWSCLLHTLHICLPALRSRTVRHSPLSAHTRVESFIFLPRTAVAVTLGHRKDTHLTLPSHTHAVGVLVGAASPVEDHLVREGDGTCLFGLTMQVAAFVSCETNTTKMTLMMSSIQWAHVSSSEWALSESAWLHVSAWVGLQLREPPETEAGRPPPRG